MFFTDYIIRNISDISIITEEDFEHFDKITFNDNGKKFSEYLYKPNSNCLFFDRGILMFEIYDDLDNNMARICYIHALWKKKNSKADSKWTELINEFWKMMKLNKCTKVKMLTKLNPDFWIKNYGFKLDRHQMERDL